MLRLTRGISVHVDQAAGRLRMGPGRRGDFTQVPLLLWLTLEGPVNEETGMLVNVVTIDEAVGEALAAEVVEAKNAVVALRRVGEVMGHKFRNIKMLRVELELSALLMMALSSEDTNMVEVTTKYELAASHRLGRAEWDEKRNLEVFGKCANPSGHGHNYLLEITLRGEPGGPAGQVADMKEVDRIVREQVISRFDHKNLNVDTAEFAEVIPTVENMAKVFWDKLLGRFGQTELVRVAVWETAKTRAEYFG